MTVNIIGAGLAGLTAAMTLSKQGIRCNLVSVQPSARAQSVLAAGGINGAINVMGEDDKPEYHEADTMKAGVFIADPEAVKGLTHHAPDILRLLMRLGVPFNMKDGHIIQRNFGGQKKKRTAYAKSSTGKIIMSVLIDEVRKYEAQGLVTRYQNHEFRRLLISGAGEEKVCTGALIRDTYTQEEIRIPGPVILATGGLNGMFPGITTGTTANTGDAASTVFTQGVRFSNLEMIQYHPTTMEIAGKRCLVSEAARGEGGRLYVMRGGEKWFFMEEKYPELGNLMPRDVVAREMYFVLRDPACGDQVYLDMSHFTEEIWTKRLSDLRSEIMHYLAIDPKTEPVPVDPAIHYFMGGIDVDVNHRTSIGHLYAAGECCSQYHGANRLGGNSMLGAIYGGKVAAETAAEENAAENSAASESTGGAGGFKSGESADSRTAGSCESLQVPEDADVPPENATADASLHEETGKILSHSLGIVRNEQEMLEALRNIRSLETDKRAAGSRESARLSLAEAMLMSAIVRRESRGAHYRSDYPKTDEAYQKKTIAEYEAGKVRVKMEGGAYEDCI